MDEATKAAFGAELAAVCQKWNVIICSSADATDDTGLESCIEVMRMVKREGQYPREETLFKCDEINELGIY
jgi:hypothetical protein